MPRGVPNPKPQDTKMQNDQIKPARTSELGEALYPEIKAPETAPQPEPEEGGKWYVMKLQRNYRPMDDKYKLQQPDGSFKAPDPVPQDAKGTEGFYHKLEAGTMVSLPMEEARRVKELGIATRADEWN